MIFVDANVFMYAVGQPHPLRAQARQFFANARKTGTALGTSTEVLQELLHVYSSTGRPRRFDAALALVQGMDVEVWPLEAADVTLARSLQEQYLNVSARDLCYLASCRRRGVRDIMTFDKTLATIANRR